MHRLLERQLRQATTGTGEIDLARLCELVSGAYDEQDRDRRRVDRSVVMMGADVASLDTMLQAKVDQLRMQKNRISAAIDNMTHGLLMIDGNGRMVVCNDRFIDAYGLQGTLLRAGSLLEDIRTCIAGTGLLSADVLDDPAGPFALEIPAVDAPTTCELADGRIIEIVRQAMADGGWVSLSRDVTEQRRAADRLGHLARHDPLTDLPNRSSFHQQLQEGLDAARQGTSIAVMLLDLDHFKAVNDTLGHGIGDLLLREVACRLREAAGTLAQAARLGGDEFAVVAIAAGNPDAAATLARRIIDTLVSPYIIGEHHIVIGVSVGIALAPHDGDDPEHILRSADKAMYHAKSSGRNTYRFFEVEMDVAAERRRLLERDLRNAVSSEQFELHFQPVLDLASNQVKGCEALIRWNHPERGRVQPLDFIPLAEESGLIGAIGSWALRRACEEAVTWPSPLHVAVNLSPVQFRQPTLAAEIVAVLDASGLPPRRLELEITEAVLLRDTETTLATLHQLRARGVRISMDDFGTGYSSLSYLRMFPFDKIKIDQSFIRELAPGSESMAIVRAVLSLGRSLQITTTAEGVETAEQMRLLRLEGCNEAQGYLISRPRPAADMLPLLEELRRGRSHAA